MQRLCCLLVVAEQRQCFLQRGGGVRRAALTAQHRRLVILQVPQPADQRQRQLGVGFPRVHAGIPLARTPITEFKDEIVEPSCESGVLGPQPVE